MNDNDMSSSANGSDGGTLDDALAGIETILDSELVEPHDPNRSDGVIRYERPDRTVIVTPTGHSFHFRRPAASCA